jgi:toxin CptA
MKSAPTIAFDYRPSRWVGVAGSVVCALAVVAPWLTALPAIGCAGLSLLAAGGGVHALRRHWKSPFQRIAWRASGWTLVDLAGVEHAALLHAHVHLGALLVLDLRYGLRARFRAVLLPDNLDAALRRQLILLLARAEVAHAE